MLSGRSLSMVKAKEKKENLVLFTHKRVKEEANRRLMLLRFMSVLHNSSNNKMLLGRIISRTRVDRITRRGLVTPQFYPSRIINKSE